MKRSIVPLMLISLSLIGCGGSATNKPLPPDSRSEIQFQSGSRIEQRRGVLNEPPGAPMYDARTATPTAPKNPQIDAVSETVRQNVRSPRDEAVARAGLGTSAATLPVPPNPSGTSGIGVGTAITLGTVVVEVNGEPIFANNLLKSIEPVLAAKAKEMDERRFRAAAVKEINDQLRTLVKDKLVYATAERNLEMDDKRLAQLITERDRLDMIRRAGGSLQLARQAAAAQGYDFDELLKDRSRVNLVRVYWERKAKPRVQVTADDMRHYYQLHKDDRFTERAQAQFRVIKVDIKRTGGRDQALAKATDLHDRAVRGEDFAAIAGAINDDPFLMKSQGDVTGGSTWMDRGAYANQKVETAVWALNPGQVTNIIESGDAFYIAKLEQKKTGRVQSFDEEAVQMSIRQTLESEQFDAARDKAVAQLVGNAIVTPEPPNTAPAIEMAMQKYPEWAAGN